MAGESARDRARRAREKAERLERYAEKWEKGADGESRTAAALGLLGPEWTHWHDLRWPGRKLANIDHLAIGPGGIFVIDSKNWSGSLTVKDGVLRQNGYRREAAVAGCADSAVAVGELVPRYLDRIRPVICFVRDQEIEGWARDVMLCSTTNLVSMLASREAVFGPDEIVDAVTTLRARMNSMPTAHVGVSTAFAVGNHSTSQMSLTPAQRTPAPQRAGRKSIPRPLKRLAAGVGIWYVAVLVSYLILRPLAGASGAVFGPIYTGLAVMAWLVARRLIK